MGAQVRRGVLVIPLPIFEPPAGPAPPTAPPLEPPAAEDLRSVLAVGSCPCFICAYLYNNK